MKKVKKPSTIYITISTTKIKNKPLTQSNFLFHYKKKSRFMFRSLYICLNIYCELGIYINHPIYFRHVLLLKPNQHSIWLSCRHFRYFWISWKINGIFSLMFYRTHQWMNVFFSSLKPRSPPRVTNINL